MTTILVTGFGPFPGAPFNPTQTLVARLARLRRPALADVIIVPHVFATSYAAVDRELPRLIAKHKPDALLMFGLAPRTRFIRIETRARNALALLPDAGGAQPRGRAIATGEPHALTMPAPARGGCSRPPAWRVCRPHCRATPDATCATTCAGRRPRAKHQTCDHASPPSCMCPTQAANRYGAGKCAVSRWTI
jgi:hypothetical protein